MVSTPVGFYESKPMPYIPYVSIKKPKLGNHFVNFPHHWMSKCFSTSSVSITIYYLCKIIQVPCVELGWMTVPVS